mgnify:CR=1 FL=1
MLTRRSLIRGAMAAVGLAACAPIAEPLAKILPTAPVLPVVPTPIATPTRSVLTVEKLMKAKAALEAGSYDQISDAFVRQYHHNLVQMLYRDTKA